MKGQTFRFMVVYYRQILWPTCHIFVYVVILPNQILLSFVWQQSCSMKSICSAVSATANNVCLPHELSFLSSSSCDITWSLSYSSSTTPDAFVSNFLSPTSQDNELYRSISIVTIGLCANISSMSSTKLHQYQPIPRALVSRGVGASYCMRAQMDRT